MFGLFFFFYFLSLGAYLRFPGWLHDINHISKVMQVLFCLFLYSRYYSNHGLLSDKLGLRKYLLWIITTAC